MKKSKKNYGVIDVNAIREQLTGSAQEKTSTPNEEQLDNSKLAKDDPDHLSRILGPPKELTEPDELLNWSKERVKALQPRVVMELENQLRYGNEKTRREVGIELSKMNGAYQQEGRGGGTVAPIMIINDLSSLPWSGKQKLLKDKVVDAKVLKAGNQEDTDA